MKNPYQIRKKIKSNIENKDSVEIIKYSDLNYAINDVIRSDNINSLLILSRNNKELDKIVVNKKINYRKLTVHKSKGLEEDYVFVTGLSDDINGFPSKYTDHKLLKYVNNYKEYYPYEEERRLFYVSLTRCRKKVYLFTPKNNMSIFIKELCKMNKKISIREK